MNREKSKKKDKCNFEFTTEGLRIKGPCAVQFVDTLSTIFEISREEGKEISASACVDPDNGEIGEIILDQVGDEKSVGISNKKLYPTDKRQISLHTHPTSGIAEFFQADIEVILERFKREIDVGHCVVGDDEAKCLHINKLKIAKNKEE